MRVDRALLVAVAAAAIALLGLYGVGVGSSTVESRQSLPLADVGYVLGDDLDAYEGFMMSGGPPPDGIPSIDRPAFVGADRARLDPGDMVIGFVHGGEARAYPQNIMVLHEIVNDRVGGLNVAITYCPLTATAQAFERGGTTLGVSGRLLNSNLVMFDRDTGSLFSQINATGLRGPYRGRTLVERDASGPPGSAGARRIPRRASSANAPGIYGTTPAIRTAATIRSAGTIAGAAPCFP